MALHWWTSPSVDQNGNSSLYTGDSQLGSLANSENPNEMPHDEAYTVCQDKNNLQRKNNNSIWKL